MYLVDGHGRRGWSAAVAWNSSPNDGRRYPCHLKVLDRRVGRGSRAAGIAVPPDVRRGQPGMPLLAIIGWL
jgi:hypothetical protein